MKQIMLLILFILLFSSCENGKWWGERLITRIEGDDGSIVTMTYDDNSHLVSYVKKRFIAYNTENYKRFDSLTLCYDLLISHTDTTVVMTGVMPYRINEDESGYTTGEIVYKLGEDGLAKSCKVIYNIMDSVSGKPYNTSAIFDYKNNQLAYISGFKKIGKDLYYEDYNFDYNHRGGSAPITIVNTFINYSEGMNKSCLMLALDDYLEDHNAAFYARILGRPSKREVTQHVVSDGYAQTVWDYDYSHDKDGYVVSFNSSKQLNVSTGKSRGLSQEAFRIGAGAVNYTIEYEK